MDDYEIDCQDILSILEKNFGFQRVQTPVGEAVELDPYTAFLYSHVTGSGYFEDTNWQFSVQSLTRIFHTACRYDFITGIYDGIEIDRSPLEMYKRRPFLFNERKRILPVSFRSRSELQGKLENYKQELGNESRNYLIQEVDLSKDGNGLEQFLEFLFTMKFRDQGYTVENQSPLGHSKGTPDAAAFNIAQEYPKGGFYFIELAMLRVGHEIKSKQYDGEYDTIVGEAKTSTTEMTQQLQKYLNTGYYDLGMEIHPDKRHPSRDEFGIFTLENDELVMSYPKNEPESVVDERKEKYREWLLNYSKFYLLANLTTSELKAYYLEETGTELDSQTKLIRFVKKISLKSIFSYIQKREDVSF
ncbi:MAG: hypothetical protein ABEJ98_01870 [Candidatus Nanohaloarchaea archaeon]